MSLIILSLVIVDEVFQIFMFRLVDVGKGLLSYYITHISYGIYNFVFSLRVLFSRGIDLTMFFLPHNSKKMTSKHASITNDFSFFL